MSTDPQIPFLTRKHRNHGLFSDHYLDVVAPATLADWQSNTLYTQVTQIRSDLAALLDSLQLENMDEAQLEEQWIKPVLERLGHFWSVQVKIRYRETGFRKPDYIFTPTEAAARGLTGEIYTPDQLKQALAVGDAKKHGMNLDRSGGKDERNPSQQLDEYLRYSELKWGILTDGQYWRIYERNTSKHNIYYEVDLVSLLKNGSGDATGDFYYFYLFFRREAFLPGGWLERILDGSTTYAENLSEQLEDEVYNALELIAQGFLNYRRNRLEATQGTLQTIYNHSLVLLYRLLFVFYAESREVLPMRDHQRNQNTLYASDVGLRSITRRISDMLERETMVKRAVDKNEVYSALQALFFIIDTGSPEYDVAPYNGRLFSEDEYPFLAKNSVGDAFMTEALDRLARIKPVIRVSERMPRRVFVDYRDLDIRHLGAIYEKLLEYQLDMATEPLTLKGGKYVPAKNGEPVIKAPGQVFLRTGNNERKITGSYYTPDYIVSFIVQHTLEPLLTGITERYARRDEEGSWIAHDPDGLRQAILDVNVLDPATGSGHFMVEVVAYIAKWLTDLHIYPKDVDQDEDELTYWKRQVVSACVYGVDVNPLAVELAKLSLWLTTIGRDRPLSFLNHHVRLGNTLVGTRMTDIRASIAPNPVGARHASPSPRAQRAVPLPNGQMTLPGEFAFTDTVGSAVGQMATIEQTIAAVVDDVKAQEKAFTQIGEALEPWRMLANVWTARHFGLTITAEQWQKLYEYTVGTHGGASGAHDGDVGAHGGASGAPRIVGAQHAAPLPDDLQKIIAAAQRLHDQYHFFHWDLAFPEVFFDKTGQPLPDAGFDAVVGNPPYVRMEAFTEQKDYLKNNFETYQGTADLYVYFFERSFQLLREGGRQSYIASSSWLYAKYATSLRTYMRQKIKLETLIDLGDNRIFKHALDVYPAIAIFSKNLPPKHDYKASVAIFTRADRVSLDPETLSNMWGTVRIDDQPEEGWQLESTDNRSLTKKLTVTGQSLKDISAGRMYRGILTGYNTAFIIDEEKYLELIHQDKNSQKILKPIISGAEVRPWYSIESKQYLIWAYQGIPIDDYPAIKRHLEQHKQALGRRWEPARGKCEWYELRPCSYYDEYDRSKIYYPEMSKYPRFSIAPEGVVSNKTAFMVMSSSLSLLAILMSRTIWYVISKTCQPIGERAGMLRYMLSMQYIEQLPIPELTAAQESQLAGYAEQITGLARERYQLHEDMRRTIINEFNGDDISTRVALYEWWDFEDEKALSDEIRRQFKTEIALGKRGEWRKFLADQKSEHGRLTGEIIRLETALNAMVYEAFHLTPEEIRLIEEATKYPYGAV